ncbi:MAG: zinc metallopeptidase, partial [Acidobacteriota bacterium]|nr:zinc metallopeptidase [Acidobacteriota bacterium]
MFDAYYLFFFIPPMLFSLWAGWRTKSAFKKYSKVRTMTGLTGAEAAKRLLDRAGIADVEIVSTQGYLSDHYNP